MTSPWGICVEGSLGPRGLEQLGYEAEQCGYSSVWTNVIGYEQHPVEMMVALARRTTVIDLGVGVIPIDQYRTDELIARLASSELDDPRWILGIGAGQMRRGALDAVTDVIFQLRSASSYLRIGVGAFGPRMLQLAGRLADAVNLNWMTPERLEWAAAQIEQGAGERTGAPTCYLYHRVAGGPGGASRLRAEMEMYAQYPVHQRHQKEVGDQVLIGMTVDDPAGIAEGLSSYPADCCHVLRPIPENRASVAAWAEVLQRLAPRNGDMDKER